MAQLTLDKTMAGVVLSRLALAGDTDMYARVMDAWLHRSARGTTTVEVTDEEAVRVRQIVPWIGAAA